MAISRSTPLPILPASNKPNTFPAKYLGAERVLLETFPVTLPVLVYILVILLAFGGVGLALYGASPMHICNKSSPSACYECGEIRYVTLKRTYYAMTDQRIITLIGLMSRTNTSVSHEHVTTIEVHEPWLMGLFFGIGTIRFSLPSFTTGTLAWLNVAVPQETWNFPDPGEYDWECGGSQSRCHKELLELQVHNSFDCKVLSRLRRAPAMTSIGVTCSATGFETAPVCVSACPR